MTPVAVSIAAGRYFLGTFRSVAYKSCFESVPSVPSTFDPIEASFELTVWTSVDIGITQLQ